MVPLSLSLFLAWQLQVQNSFCFHQTVQRHRASLETPADVHLGFLTAFNPHRRASPAANGRARPLVLGGPSPLHRVVKGFDLARAVFKGSPGRLDRATDGRGLKRVQVLRV